LRRKRELCVEQCARCWDPNMMCVVGHDQASGKIRACWEP
jgi:hypothetical protein